MDPNVSDGTLIIYNSNSNANLLVKFQGLFPTSLSTIEFDATKTDLQYVVAIATFKYAIYDIIKYEPG
jgi:hypothetical protein